jgi:hypothetical protein
MVDQFFFGLGGLFFSTHYCPQENSNLQPHPPQGCASCQLGYVGDSGFATTCSFYCSHAFRMSTYPSGCDNLGIKLLSCLLDCPNCRHSGGEFVTYGRASPAASLVHRLHPITKNFRPRSLRLFCAPIYAFVILSETTMIPIYTAFTEICTLLRLPIPPRPHVQQKVLITASAATRTRCIFYVREV